MNSSSLRVSSATARLISASSMVRWLVPTAREGVAAAAVIGMCA
jgi:hypothetical protein